MSAIMSQVIRKSLYTIINEHIKQNELKEQLFGFVDYQSKKGFPFGELLVLHYNIFNGTRTEEIYSVAAAIEILILSFDMLDDFEDDDFKDKPWSTESNLALNATTALLFLSAIVIRNTGFKNKDKCISTLLKYALQSINGQHKDLLNNCKNEADYIEMTIEKSGSLVALSCLVGSVLAAGDYPVEVGTYSRFIGLIGQINNDLSDIKTWDEKNDLINKKFSLPIIYLLNYKDEELKFIHDYYDNKIEKNEIIKNQKLISNKFVMTGAIAYTEVIKKVYQNKTIEEIKKLNIDQYYIDLLVKYIY
ncbi:polyprenyl synthetase family protein [Bacillus sp. FJAT-49705]|uniref:Polyprenyl synthetase family protein n=1 Tax=Cytobacillus citreus TaxID=2833586 RepID=A0ABS5NPP6_9BACI|nr:polyprenyl synthetase family protein [Cytobacillus citreus]MBS4189770.1 polyprenyl synthetase family protein [Cytobacillus citreus]